MQIQTNKKEDFIMLKVIQLFIGQSWELILNIIKWISIHVSVGWLAFGLAIITFLRNRHRKLRQSFEYSSGSNNFETAIFLYKVDCKINPNAVRTKKDQLPLK